jgi:hypothetical protein
MPWTLAREGQTLHVRLSGPLGVGSLAELVTAIGEEIQTGVKSVVLPTKVEGGSALAQATLAGLWEMLANEGVVVQRSGHHE